MVRATWCGPLGRRRVDGMIEGGAGKSSRRRLRKIIAAGDAPVGCVRYVGNCIVKRAPRKAKAACGKCGAQKGPPWNQHGRPAADHMIGRLIIANLIMQSTENR